MKRTHGKSMFFLILMSTALLVGIAVAGEPVDGAGSGLEHDDLAGEQDGFFDIVRHEKHGLAVAVALP